MTQLHEPSCLGFSILSSHYIFPISLPPFIQLFYIQVLFLLYILLFFRFTAPQNCVVEAKTFFTHAIHRLYPVYYMHKNVYTYTHLCISICIMYMVKMRRHYYYSINYASGSLGRWYFQKQSLKFGYHDVEDLYVMRK